MANGAANGFKRISTWATEMGVGLFVVMFGLLGLGLGPRAVRGLIDAVFRTRTLPFVVESSLGFATTVFLLGVLFAGVGLGLPYTYLTYRELNTVFSVEWPDRSAVVWLGGLGVMALVLIGAGTLGHRVVGAPGSGIGWEVPVVMELPGSMPQTPGVHLPWALVIPIVVVGGGTGLAVGGLFHGILQNAFRQTGSRGVSIGGTALAVGVFLGGTTNPVGLVIRVIFAVGVGYAYDLTENLGVPIAAYAVLNAVSLITAFLLIQVAAGRI